MVGPSPFQLETGLDEKHQLRAAMRALRREHVAEQPDSIRALLFLRPPSPLVALAPEGSAVGLYHARGAEAPTRAYAKWFLENGRTLALPWFEHREAPMRFRAWLDPFDDSDLEPGPFGILQPLGEAPELTPGLALVPLLAFTPDLHRLGQGGGHYDRWLEANPKVLPIGLAWDCQRLEQVPVETHDRLLHAVVTPTRLYERAG